MKIAIMKDPDGTLFFELPEPPPLPAPTLAEEAKLAEEVKGQLAEKDNEIASLKAKLAEEPAQLSDQERFEELVGDIASLSKDGKARLAEEAPGWTYQESKAEPNAEQGPALIIAEATPVVAVATPGPVKRFRVVVKG